MFVAIFAETIDQMRRKWHHDCGFLFFMWYIAWLETVWCRHWRSSWDLCKKRKIDQNTSLRNVLYGGKWLWSWCPRSVWSNQ